KIGRNPLAQLSFRVEPENSVEMIYPLQDSAFGGSVASWVGQYEKPAEQVEMSVRGLRDGTAVEMKNSAALPEKSLEHQQLPRLWARARVDALLEKIERDGEDAKSVEGIIRLSRKYKFVTPYTSFLAVPRALLRPRVIRPGDPILRVHTDESINSVVAIFPFGLTKRLRYLDNEDVWQTRFLAPDDMQDGTYSVGLVLRDKAGHTYPMKITAKDGHSVKASFEGRNINLTEDFAFFVVVESDALDQAGDSPGCGSAFRDCGIHVWGFIFPWTVCLGDEKCCVWLPLSFGWNQPTPPVEAHQDVRRERRCFELIEASRVGGWYRSECHRRRSGNHN